MSKLPSVTSAIPRDLKIFIDRVREAINGTGENSLVTVRQLVASGIASANGSGGLTVPPAPAVTAPVSPTGFTASGSLMSVILEWNAPSYQGHSHTEVYAAAQTQEQADANPEEFPSISDATLVGMVPGNNFAHYIGSNGSRYYWIRFVNRNGEAGPYNGTDGTVGTTDQSPTDLITNLSGAIAASELATSLTSRINLIDGGQGMPGSVNARLNTLETTLEGADTALSQSITQLTTTVGGNTASIQTNGSSIDGIEAKYTVKIDNSGHISGYGLISENNDGAVTSAFGVRADDFFVAPPAVSSSSAPTTNLFKGKVWRNTSNDVIKYYTGTSWSTTPQAFPLVVKTSSSTINGQSVGPGVYMDTAYIADATIDNAKIKDLTADKITASLLNTVDFYGNTIAGSTMYLGGTVVYTQDSDGNNIGIDSVTTPAATLNSSGVNIAVSSFQINDGSTDYSPFQIVSNVAYLNNAMIKDATLSFAKVADDIQSTNYNAANNTGWKLEKDGTLDLNEASITAGILQSTDGNFVIDLTNKTISIET